MSHCLVLRYLNLHKENFRDKALLAETWVVIGSAATECLPALLSAVNFLADTFLIQVGK